MFYILEHVRIKLYICFILIVSNCKIQKLSGLLPVLRYLILLRIYNVRFWVISGIFGYFKGTFTCNFSLKMYILACSITSIESKLVFDLPLNLKMGSNGLLGSLTYVYITQTDDQSKFLSCDVTFGQIRRSDQSKTVEWYNCPAGCTTLNQFEVIGKENGFYSIHSSICRSAIHKGIISG